MVGRPEDLRNCEFYLFVNGERDENSWEGATLEDVIQYCNETYTDDEIIKIENYVGDEVYYNDPWDIEGISSTILEQVREDVKNCPQYIREIVRSRIHEINSMIFDGKNPFKE